MASVPSRVGSRTPRVFSSQYLRQAGRRACEEVWSVLTAWLRASRRVGARYSGSRCRMAPPAAASHRRCAGGEWREGRGRALARGAR
eukprot:9971588-Alexandrium_andersonii.AAC.1